MAEIKLTDFLDNAKYQIQYIDSLPGDWTVPVLFTRSRMEFVVSDKSISKLKLITETTELELDII